MSSAPSSAPDTVIRNATLVSPEGMRREPLALCGGCVADVSATGALSLDLRDHLVFPGLVNAHDHLQLNCFPETIITETFPNSYAWIEAFQECLATPEFAEVRAIPSALRHWQGALKNLFSGVTTVAHHDPCPPVCDDPAFPVFALRRFGWSHSLGLGLPNDARSPLAYGPPVAESFAACPATQPWFIHLAEGTDAVAASELAALEALGCLAPNTVLIHGVGLTEKDITLILKRGAGVVWCPRSNLKMLGRTLHPRRLLEAGCLALGTDSRLTGSRDLLEELRLALEQSDIAPRELLSLVTTAGSRLLKLPDVGGLSPGQQADLLILRDPGGDPYEALLDLRRAGIRAVVRGGKPALADPDFAGWFEACGIAATPIRLDGRPKLCASDRLGPPGVAELESGLEVLEAQYV